MKKPTPKQISKVMQELGKRSHPAKLLKHGEAAVKEQLSNAGKKGMEKRYGKPVDKSLA